MVRSGLLGILVLCCCAICLCIEAGSASAFGMELCTKKAEGTPTAGKFEDAECTKTNEKGEWQRVTPHESLAMKASVVGASQFTSTVGPSNTPVAFECSSFSNTGGLGENVEEGAIKTVKGKGRFFHYGGCTVSKPAGCKIVGGTFETEGLKLLAYSEAGATKVSFAPESGTTLAEVEISGCAIAGAYPLNGTFVGVVPAGEESRVKFTTASGSTLTLGSHSATYTATTKSVKEGTTEPIFFGS
jgi:hypothetical protein